MDEGRIEELTAAAAAGDRAALEALIERYLPDLRAFVRLRSDERLRQRESSSDLVQSVCRELLQHADRFQHPDEAAFRRWLFTTALRKIRDRQDYHLAARRDARAEARPASESAARALLERFSGVLTPSRVVAARDEVARIEHAMDALPEEYREVITLAHLLGLSRAEIAVETGRSEGAVRMLLHRALARLAAELEP